MTLSWWGVHAGVGVRGEYRLGGWFVPFAQLGAGVSAAQTHFSDEGDRTTKEWFGGWHIGASAGVRSHGEWGRHGLYLRLDWRMAPVIDNLLGDTHDIGGTFLSIGVRRSF
jgi:hypothetical protein